MKDKEGAEMCGAEEEPSRQRGQSMPALWDGAGVVPLRKERSRARKTLNECVRGQSSKRLPPSDLFIVLIRLCLLPPCKAECDLSTAFPLTKLAELLLQQLQNA